MKAGEGYIQMVQQDGKTVNVPVLQMGGGSGGNTVGSSNTIVAAAGSSHRTLLQTLTAVQSNEQQQQQSIEITPVSSATQSIQVMLLAISTGNVIGNQYR